MTQEVKQIIFNQKTYHFLVYCAEYYCAEKMFDKSLFFCQKAADFATFNYCGFYAEGRLEVLLAKIGNPKKPLALLPSQAESRLRVLHYATYIYAVGGHTRLIENWITNDSDNHHDLVLANYEEPVPDFITAALTLVQGQLIQLAGKNPLEQAHTLACLKEQYDVIVLHHHPNDLLPALAFSVAGGTPVAVLNHGDHRYWLGAGICDILIEIRDNLTEIDYQRRQVDNICLLPIPVAARNITKQDYTASRLLLGVEEEEVMLLSIGSSYKYQPIDDRNFFLDVHDILERNAQAKMFIVGIPADSEIAYKYAHPRLKFVPPVNELDVFRNACDIYIVSYPFTSFTAYLEVARLGKPVQRMYDAPLLNRYELTDYPNPVQYPADLVEWQRNIQLLIAEPEMREAQGLDEKCNLVTHDLNSWQQYVTSFYKMLPQLKHEFRKLKEIDVLVDVNDKYLYKMQREYFIKIEPYYFYGLPFKLKMKLILNGLISELSLSLMNSRRIMWFLFKSSGFQNK